jgi:UDP-N-acetyl-D-mannosaminuronate dehydrogenase
MAKKPRFYGWEFGDSPTDQAALAIYRRFQEQNQDFASHCKRLIVEYEQGDLVEANGNGIAAVVAKLNEIQKMLQNGALVYQGSSENPGTDDDDLLSILGDMGT